MRIKLPASAVLEHVYDVVGLPICIEKDIIGIVLLDLEHIGIVCDTRRVKKRLECL